MGKGHFKNVLMSKKIHHIYIPEERYYAFYMEHTRAILALDELHSIKEWDSLVIHCDYGHGVVDHGRHISPIYKLITGVQTELPGLKDGFSLVHFK